MSKRETCRYAKPLIELVGDESVVSPDVSECITVRSAQQILNDADCECCRCWKEKETTDAKLDQLNQLLKEHEEQQAKLAAKDERIEGLLEAAIASVSRDHANALAAKDAEIERLKGDNARFQSAHDGLLAEIDKLAKHDMAVGTALREMRDALRKCDESSASRSGGPCDCGACRNARAVLAKYAPLAGEANHA